MSHTPTQDLIDPAAPTRVWSRADVEALFKRIVAITRGGGDTEMTLRLTWTGNLRWGRNRPTTAGDTTELYANITRIRNGVRVDTTCDQFDDAALTKSIHELESRLVEAPPADSQNPTLPMLSKQTYLPVTTWDEATAGMTMRQLSDAARRSVDPVVDSKLFAAGYVAVTAALWAIYNTRGLDAYATASGAVYTETVRDLEGTASGWAAKSHQDWNKLDVMALSGTALRTCKTSAGAVAIEPGRYTTILTPGLVGLLMFDAVKAMDRNAAETGKTVYTLTKGVSKLGKQVFDSRLTITSDPQDPECGFMPFDPEGNPYSKVTWVENGVLKALSYDRDYARRKLNSDTPLPNPLAFRMSGGTTSIEEMIASTERGLLLNHMSKVTIDDPELLLVSSLTRDGVWLIERGKITHPVKNMWFTESPMTAFNKITHLGPPERTPGVSELGWLGVLRDLPSRAVNDGRVPIVAPALRVEDFHFTRLIDAV